MLRRGHQAVLIDPSFPPAFVGTSWCVSWINILEMEAQCVVGCGRYGKVGISKS